MELTLNRSVFTPTSTIGTLLIDGFFECFTLEDAVREGPKVYGKTAIPAGRYAVKITMSQRFQREMPQLLDVPGFQGIRIHAGNTDADTDGCILVGRTKGADFIGDSRAAMNIVMFKLRAAERQGDSVFITINNQRSANADS